MGGLFETVGFVEPFGCQLLCGLVVIAYSA
jgi:hypothetical protein